MVQRRSDVHNPRIDDEMAKEVRSLDTGAPIESRSRPDLLQEDFGTEGGDTHAAGEAPGVPTGLTPAEIDMRSELAQSLRPHDFPATRGELLEAAGGRFAPARVLAVLDDLPDGRYEVLEQVWEALGHGGEARS
jgi:hypothetical protein